MVIWLVVRGEMVNVLNYFWRDFAIGWVFVEMHIKIDTFCSEISLYSSFSYETKLDCFSAFKALKSNIQEQTH